MDLPDAGPLRPATLISPALLTATMILIFLVACREKEKRPVTVKKQSPDSSGIRSRHLTDSLARVQSQKKKIYITFDDGPNTGTMNVLHAVKETGVPASFFIVARHTYDSPEQALTWETLKASPGIDLCNHSFSHAANHYSRFYKDPRKVVADIERSRDSLHFSNNVVRMPGRNAWRIDKIRHTDVRESREAIDSVFEAGFSVMGWDVEWGYDHQALVPDADTSYLFRRIENLLNDKATRKPGHLVLLAHDQAFRHEEDLVLLKAVLTSLKNNPDYELVLASGFPGVNSK